ncbi:ATP-binding protein [Planobispora rosea]|uniref:ATP-binding protein n=1 Tax=Planobispora rosea TaxID=35762 RepID=A0A8J3WCT3_PLARO|nr:ATP-binding protein [Planobispora rosea]GGS64100.1 ATP-binding protein [Planobispora rosea]GIH84560.1 ATP-binding protein [Planobispora rosea]
MNSVIVPEGVEAEILGEACLALDPASTAQARACVREWIGADHRAYENVRLATSELVTNAAVHADRGRAGSLIVLTLTRVTNLLYLEVTDPGGDFSWPRAFDTVPEDAECGRGLTIVRELSRGRWGVRDRGILGRTVWCVLDASPDPVMRYA